jgi:DsbC/DsbD-like thiol-disulfide interchange protein
VNLKITAWMRAPTAILALWMSNAASAPGASTAGEPLHVGIEAVAERQSVAPGQTFRVALIEHIQPGWHTYWINPGDAGLATKLRWTLPEGFQIDAVQWPVPQVFRSGPLVTYGYEGEVVLLQQVHASTAVSSAAAHLSVEAQWLVCQDICIPEHAAAQLTLQPVPSAAHEGPTASTALFKSAAERLPRPSPWSTSLATGDSSIVLTVHGIARELPPAAQVQFLPLSWGEIDNAAKQSTARAGEDLRLTLVRGDLRSAPLEALDGVLLLGSGSGKLAGQGFLLHAVAGAATTHAR